MKSSVSDEKAIADLPAEFPKAGHGGLPSKWSRDVAETVLERVAGGETVSTISQQVGLGKSTWTRWVLAIPALARLWEIARRRASHALFDEAIDLARANVTAPKSEVVNSATRLAVDTLMKAAGKLNPPEYGDKSLPSAAINITINTNLPLGAGSGGNLVGDPSNAEFLDLEPSNQSYKVVAKLPDEALSTAPPADTIAPQPKIASSTLAMRRKRAREKAAREADNG